MRSLLRIGLACTLLLRVGDAFAFGVTGYGLLNITPESMTPDASSISAINTVYDSQAGSRFGLGVLIDSALTANFAIESGILYLPSAETTLFLGGPTEHSWKTVQIPLALRFTGLKPLSIGAGPYFEQFLGDGTNVGTQGVLSQNWGYGILFGAQARIPMTTKLDFVADARYELGLTNYALFPGYTTEKFNHFLMMAGIRSDF
jgi:hypothetical protein